MTKSILKFTLIFALTTILPVVGFFKYQHDKTPFEVKQYSDSQIRKTCPNSPEDEYYSECLQKNLSRMYSSSSIFDLHKITGMLKEVKNRDLYVGSLNEEQKTEVYTFYLYNWIISIDHLSNFSASRKGISFLGIFVFPLLKNIVFEQLQDLKIELKNLRLEKPTDKFLKYKARILSSTW